MTEISLKITEASNNYCKQYHKLNLHSKWVYIAYFIIVTGMRHLIVLHSLLNKDMGFKIIHHNSVTQLLLQFVHTMALDSYLQWNPVSPNRWWCNHISILVVQWFIRKHGKGSIWHQSCMNRTYIYIFGIDWTTKQDSSQKFSKHTNDANLSFLQYVCSILSLFYSYYFTYTGWLKNSWLKIR